MASYVKAGFDRDLRGLIADLEAVELGLGTLVEEVGAQELGPIVLEVKAAMPFDPEHRGWRDPADRPSRRKRKDPGHIRDSVRGNARGSTLVVESRHPGSGVQWWSGSIAPKGTTIEIKHHPGTGHDFESKAAADVGRKLQQAYDRLAREHGL